ncbi:MAG TPA: hypothetical protein VKA46_02065 [Gemmataceae bacterium]|nr:hypothetical protein [Gemmataceae bacterium]
MPGERELRLEWQGQGIAFLRRFLEGLKKHPDDLVRWPAVQDGDPVELKEVLGMLPAGDVLSKDYLIGSLTDFLKGHERDDPAPK